MSIYNKIDDMLREYDGARYEMEQVLIALGKAEKIIRTLRCHVVSEAADDWLKEYGNEVSHYPHPFSDPSNAHPASECKERGCK